MIVRSVRHRGLRRLLEDDNPRLLRQTLVNRERKILTVLILAVGTSVSLLPTLRPAGASTDSQVTGRMNGAFLYQAIGESRLKKRIVISTT